MGKTITLQVVKTKHLSIRKQVGDYYSSSSSGSSSRNSITIIIITSNSRSSSGLITDFLISPHTYNFYP
jgi:hypothetical protein